MDGTGVVAPTDDKDDLTEGETQALCDMISSAVTSACRALGIQSLTIEDEDRMKACIKNRSKRTLAGRWGRWHNALLTVLNLGKVCTYDECLFPKGSCERLSLEEW